MARTGKQSPLGINTLGSLLSGTGLNINSNSTQYVGTSKTNTAYQFGKILTDTCLRLLTHAINVGYLRGPGAGNTTLTNLTYDNLISIGVTSLGALGNSKPATYQADDPTGKWTAAGTPATTGYSISGNIDQGQSASWLPYTTSNPNKSITQWGYLRLHALQAWNEFNWNGISPTSSVPVYKDFCGSFMAAESFIKQINSAILSAHNADAFLDGVYSNMNDLISADVAGVSLSTRSFGQDLKNLGRVINFSRIDAFGLPSVLLETIINNNAMTQDLSLLLLSSGLSSSELNEISNRKIRPSIQQEQKIYSAFLLITGANLVEILAALGCYTVGLNTLADLLNLRMLFPTSYMSLTVPVYNQILGLPTNSKTYYLIYQDDGINSSLSSSEMNEYVGEQIPSGPPLVRNISLSPENYSSPRTGFGSYLFGIIPDDQAVAAGAFQYSIRQIRKVEQVDPLTFAKSVSGIETISDLSLINGTSKPTNQFAIDACAQTLALGSGPHGSYTPSDMFGCMSGLPYAWKLLYDRIRQLQTQKLYNIYQQLYLATSWEQATATVNYSTADVGGTLYYTPTSITILNSGGGYGRGTAPAPTITLSNGGTASITIGTNDTNAGISGNYGRVIDITLLTPGPATTTIPTATIQCPPTATLAVASDGSVATSGTNGPSGTTGWQNPMNAVVQAYIDQANTEIAAIQTNNSDSANYLIAYWNSIGSQLTIEQRTRYNVIPPVSLTRDDTLNPSPSTLITFVDMIPTYSLDTVPHGAAQTLEAISDYATVGGQSIVGMMRQERNQVRLMNAGIDLDNNISNTLSDMETKTLITNGVLADAGINNSINGYTNPAWAACLINSVDTSPIPAGIYMPSDTELTGSFIETDATRPGDITPILQNASVPVISTNVPVGPKATVDSPTSGVVIIKSPDQLDPSNLPAILDPSYASSTLLPASPSVGAAIDKVTECNCDCWIK